MASAARSPSIWLFRSASRRRSREARSRLWRGHDICLRHKRDADCELGLEHAKSDSRRHVEMLAPHQQTDIGDPPHTILG
jgi:hypothetical protein